MADWWMVTLPNERAGEDSTFQKLCAATHGLAGAIEYSLLLIFSDHSFTYFDFILLDYRIL